MTSQVSGRSELRTALRQDRALFWAVGVFSVFANLLMLTGPIYMLQVYDRVLSSGSVETLVALSLLVLFLFSFMGLLDFARARVLARIGARFQARLERRVFDAVMTRAPGDRGTSRGGTLGPGPRDLDQVQRVMSAPVSMAVFDVPSVPFFFFAIWVFHPWLGWLAILGGLVLVLIAILNQVISKSAAGIAGETALSGDTMMARASMDAEMINALGMRDAMFQRWHRVRRQALDAYLGATDVTGSFFSLAKTLRLLLQSAMLGLGAFLVLRGDLTAGAMIAASILLGRALAPVEQVTGGWPMIQAARKSWTALAGLLDFNRPESSVTRLPRPDAVLDVQNVTVVSEGKDMRLLQNVSFALEPGQAVGVIGPSGAGKSTLARVLTGALQPTEGEVRLGGATLDQYSQADRGKYIGYLPQNVHLFEGTVSENIARLPPVPVDAERVIEASRTADAHGVILDLPNGYDTALSGSGDRLSGGERQRIALARALYDTPVLLVLDEPNSNLDNAGSDAVNAAIREIKSKGGAVFVIAHRPAAIKECELVLMLEAGRVRAFGLKNAVLRDVLHNGADVIASHKNGGML